MEILITLDLDPSSSLGRKVKYLSDLSNQLNNLYQVVDSTLYKNSINDSIANISAYVLNTDQPGGEAYYDSHITNIETYKDLYFYDYGNYFKNQYIKPT